MKKIIIAIIAVLVVGAGITAGVLLMNKNNKLKKSFEMDSYKFNINATAVENENKETYFTTSFETVRDNNGGKEVSLYFVDFDELSTDKVPGKAVDVKINKKNFKYILDDSRTMATLYYQIPKTDKNVIISVSGGSVYVDGQQLKMLAVVDDDLIKSKELAETLDFEIVK